MNIRSEDGEIETPVVPMVSEKGTSKANSPSRAKVSFWHSSLLYLFALFQGSERLFGYRNSE